MKERLTHFWNSPVPANKEDIAKVRQFVARLSDVVEGGVTRSDGPALVKLAMQVEKRHLCL